MEAGGKRRRRGEETELLIICESHRVLMSRSPSRSGGQTSLGLMDILDTVWTNSQTARWYRLNSTNHLILLNTSSSSHTYIIRKWVFVSHASSTLVVKVRTMIIPGNSHCQHLYDEVSGQGLAQIQVWVGRDLPHFRP